MVTVGGIELYVRRLGDPGLPPLVIIHGGPTWDAEYLLPAVGELTDVAHVVLPDLRGCGRSARVTPYGKLTGDQLQPDLIADDVAGLIRELGWAEADLLGFSFGGRIAMRVVQQHPDVVRRLVLASTTAYTDFADELRDTEGYAERAARCPDVSWDDPALQAEDGALSRAMAYAQAPVQIWRLDRLDAWHRVLERTRFTSDFNRPYAEGTLRPGGPADAVTVLRDWGGPVLILHGARDQVFPIGVARRLHAELPGSALTEIPEAGHMAHFDNPVDWLNAVRGFLG